MNRGSGAVRGRAIAGCKTGVRDALYMAAPTAIRHNPAIRAAHRRPRDRVTA